ncbi:MAG: putative metallopeptidase [Candidatus Nanopelagicales bacterium]
MATTYVMASEDVLAVMRRVIDVHDVFADIGKHVNIEVLMAWADSGAAVKLHGDRVAAKIKVVGGEERSRGGPDVRIVIDAKTFGKMSPRTRMALFAHELYHIQVQRQLGGLIKVDAYDRPIIKLIDDDWCINGFQRVAEWYGDASVEVQAYKRVGEVLGQGTLPFGASAEDDDEDDDDEE